LFPPWLPGLVPELTSILSVAVNDLRICVWSGSSKLPFGEDVLRQCPCWCLGVSYVFCYFVSSTPRGIYCHVCVYSVTVNFTFMKPRLFPQGCKYFMLESYSTKVQAIKDPLS
jgi:hypothetical protein